MGSQNGRKIYVFGVFLSMFLETLFLVEFGLIFDKIDGEKQIDLSSIFFVIFCFFSNARNLKNRAPIEARAQLLSNRVFLFLVPTGFQNQPKKLWILKSKIKTNR